MDVAGDLRLEAKIGAALAGARVRRLSGDLQGAREVVLSVLAIDEDHAEARQLLAELELGLLQPATRQRPGPEVRKTPPPSRQPAPQAPPALPAPPAPPATPATPVSPLDGPAWPAVVKPAETPKPLPEPRPAAVGPAAPKAAVRAPSSRGLSRIQLGAIVLGVGVLAVGAVLLTRSPSRTGAPVPPTAAPSAPASRPAAVPAVTAAPRSPVAPPTASPVDPDIGRKVEALLARGDYTAAERAVDDGLRADPSEPSLRALQQRVQTDARSAADGARGSLGEARAAAEKAGAAERAPRAFRQARDLDAEATGLYARQLWTGALAKAVEATAAYTEAQAQARGEAARAAYEQMRARAAEAGAEKLAAPLFTEAVARAARAEAAWQRRELGAAAGELEWAASTMEQARRAAVEAAAAAPPATPAAPASRGEADREAILAVINGYTAAMEGRNLAALRTLWPGLGGAQEAKIRSAFQFAKSVRVQLDVTSVQIGNGTAVVSCQRKVTIVTTEGQTAQNDQPAVIRLVKTDGWRIEAIQ